MWPAHSTKRLWLAALQVVLNNHQSHVCLTHGQTLFVHGPLLVRYNHNPPISSQAIDPPWEGKKKKNTTIAATTDKWLSLHAIEIDIARCITIDQRVACLDAVIEHATKHDFCEH